MPSQKKPSNWQPLDLDSLKEIDCWYSDEVWGAIHETFSVEPDKRLELCDRVLGAAMWLHSDLHFEHRPGFPEKTSALLRFSEKVAALREAYENMDADSQRALFEASKSESEDTAWRDRFSTQIYLDDLCFLEIWAKTAAQGLQRGNAGRKSQDGIREALVRLRDIWADFHGREPELDKFLLFARTALGPVLEQHSESLPSNFNMEGLARQALYQIGSVPDPD